MFENFVTFKEVIKLEKKIFHEEAMINCDNRVLNLILHKQDTISLESIFESLDITSFIKSFAKYFDITPISKGSYSRIDFLAEVIRIILKYLNFPVRIIVVAPHPKFEFFDFIRRLTHLDRILDINDLRDMMLIYSAEVGNLKLMKYLRSQEADLRIYDNEVLKTAVRHRKFNIIEYLIDNDVDINADEGFVLSYACNDPEMAKFLLDNGGDLEKAKKYLLSDEDYPSERMRKYLELRSTKHN